MVNVWREGLKRYECNRVWSEVVQLSSRTSTWFPSHYRPGSRNGSGGGFVGARMGPVRRDRQDLEKCSQAAKEPKPVPSGLPGAKNSSLILLLLKPISEGCTDIEAL